MYLVALNFLTTIIENQFFGAMIKSSFFIFLFFNLSGLYAQYDTTIQTRSYTVVKDLKKDWMTIDEKNEYIPFVENIKQKAPVVSFPVSLIQYQGYWLEYCVPEKSTVLINKSITSYYPEQACVRYQTDVLRKTYQQDTIWITIYFPNHSYDAVSTSILGEGFQAVHNNMPVIRKKNGLSDFFATGFVLLLISYALLLNNFPKAFKNFHSSHNIFSLNVKEDTFTKVTFVNRSNLIFILHYCFLIAYLFIILNSSANIIKVELPGYPIKSFGSFIIVWLELSGIALLLVAIKYILIVAIGALFRITRLVRLHLLDYYRMSVTYGSYIFIFLTGTYLLLGNSETFYYNIFVYLVVIFSIARVFLLYYRLFGAASFRNIYLISYICTSEVLPLFIGLKFFLIS